MQVLIDQLLARRYLLALFTFLLGGIVAWGILSTTIDSTVSSILSEDDPYRQEVEQVRKDCDRDYFMSAQEALDYGLIDEVLKPGKKK